MLAHYLVASVTQPMVSMKVITPDGELVDGMVQVVEVELVDENGKWGSITRRFRTAEEKAYALAKYIQGEYVDIEA